MMNEKLLSAQIEMPLRDFSLSVSLTVTATKPLAIVGASGSGKTTILRSIAGLARPASGEIKLGSKTLFSSTDGICLPPEKRHVGFLFQEHALFPHLTVLENASYSNRLPRAQVRALLKSFSIEHIADSKPPRISGGESQRTALARAIASKPRLLLLDEPTSSLDRTSRNVVLNHLAETLARQNIPVILVTHSAVEAEILGARVLELHRGQIE